MASFVYTSCVNELALGELDFSAGDFAVLLADPAYEPSRTHSRRSDVEEASGEGYTSGGKPVDVQVTTDREAGITSVALGGTAWPTSTVRSRYAVYYHVGAGDAVNEELVAVIDFGGEVESSNGLFSLTESIIRLRS
jgi:hypothetical protein